MGAAQSTVVPDILAGLGERLTEEECQQLAERLGWPEEKFEEFWKDALGEEETTISKKKVESKIKRVLKRHRKSQAMDTPPLLQGTTTTVLRRCLAKVMPASCAMARGVLRICFMTAATQPRALIRTCPIVSVESAGSGAVMVRRMTLDNPRETVEELCTRIQSNSILPFPSSCGFDILLGHGGQVLGPATKLVVHAVADPNGDIAEHLTLVVRMYMSDRNVLEVLHKAWHHDSDKVRSWDVRKVVDGIAGIAACGSWRGVTLQAHHVVKLELTTTRLKGQSIGWSGERFIVHLLLRLNYCAWYGNMPIVQASLPVTDLCKKCVGRSHSDRNWAAHPVDRAWLLRESADRFVSANSLDCNW